MKRKIWFVVLGITMVTSLILSIALPTTAAGSVFLTPITITDTSGTSRTNYPVIVPLNISSMQATGMLSASGLDSGDLIGTSAQKFMFTNTGILINQSTLAAYQSNTNNLYTNGYSPAQTSMPIIVGDGGYITTLYNASLELGSNFTLEIDGCIDATGGSSRYLCFKDSAITVDVSTASTITVHDIGDSITLSHVITSGEHDIKVVGDSSTTTISLYDGATLLASNSSFTTIASNTNNYIWDQNSVMPYINYIKISQGTPNWQETGNLTVFENYQTSTDIGWGPHALAPGFNQWLGEVISVSSDHDVTGITIYPAQSGNPVGGNLTVNIYAVDINNKPTGSPLDSATYPIGSLPNTPNLPPDVVFNMPLKTVLLSGTNYAIVIHDSQYHAYPKFVYGDWEQVTSSTSSGGAVARLTSTDDVPSDWTVASGAQLSFIVEGYTVVNNPVYGEVLKYQPSTIIQGDVLPDVDSTQDGVITFGTNSGVSFLVGGSTSGTSYIAGSGGNIGIPTPIPVPGNISGYVEQTTEPTQMPEYDLFHQAAQALGWGTFTLYGLLEIFVAICLGMGVGVATGSALLAGLACFTGLVVGAGTGQLGWWIVICYGILSVSWLGAAKAF